MARRRVDGRIDPSGFRAGLRHVFGRGRARCPIRFLERNYCLDLDGNFYSVDMT